jgi:glycosyltransferase involved in cell wall biosynthesis
MNTGKYIHIHNGGNSIFSIFLRLFGKKVFISQDGVDWKRDKWSVLGRIYLFISSYITAYFPNKVIFDNIYTKEFFEKKFNRHYNFIPYGSEISDFKEDKNILNILGVEPSDYFLFIGRFIPDKGLQYLIPAFEKVKTNKKLIIVGGSPNPSDFEISLKSTKDCRIIFPGYIYGNDVNNLIKFCYAYIQPSDVEGLSPVILSVMSMGVPIICSNIKENLYIVKDTAVTFEKSSINDLSNKIRFAIENPDYIKRLSVISQKRVKEEFSWDKVAKDHFELFLSA